MTHTQIDPVNPTHKKGTFCFTIFIAKENMREISDLCRDTFF